MARILVVEDNQTNMELTTILLRHIGHQVFQAKDAETGLALAHSEQLDLILMDIQLPGMDGLAATQKLKGDSATRAIKVVALTAFAMRGDEAKMMAAGCDGYLAKPIQYASFVEKIRQILE